MAKVLAICVQVNDDSFRSVTSDITPQLSDKTIAQVIIENSSLKLHLGDVLSSMGWAIFQNKAWFVVQNKIDLVYALQCKAVS